jgi:hypothetical protein
MAGRFGRPELVDSGIALAVALVAAVVARSVQEMPNGRLPSLAAVAPYWLPLVAWGWVVAELAVWPVRRWMGRGAAEAATARLVAWLAMTLVAAVRADSDPRAEGPAALAALTFVGLVLPVRPLPGGVLLEASLARRLPQLVAARLAARIGFTAALLVPGVLLLASKVRTDAASATVLCAAAVALLVATRHAASEALVLELALQARRDGSELPRDLRRELLAQPLPPQLGPRRPLAPEQFRLFRGACERAWARRRRRAPARAEE